MKWIASENIDCFMQFIFEILIFLQELFRLLEKKNRKIQAVFFIHIALSVFLNPAPHRNEQ